jgi:hypothetical protein
VLGGGQSVAPRSADFFIGVGPTLSSWPSTEVTCPVQPNGDKVKCFVEWGERAVAADPITPKKVYVAFVHADPKSHNSDIYFTRSSGGSNWGTWTTALMLNTSQTGYYYDPQITVDSQGTIFVSYSVLSTYPDTTGSAKVYLLWSPDGGTTWFAGQGSTWNTSSLQYHCGRGYFFIGDFRDNRAFGNRALFTYQQGGSATAPYRYRERWVSRADFWDSN